MTDEVKALENQEERLEEMRTVKAFIPVATDRQGYVIQTPCVVTCPACGDEVRAIASDGVVKGLCTKEHVRISVRV